MLAQADENGERWYDSELHRVKGSILRKQAEPTRIEMCFRQAIVVAREQNAKFFEVRASTSLARFWRDQGRRAEARDLLAPVHAWFTEGFDVPDLIEAKALLQELNGS
jgi:predicted ATPase